MQWVVRLLINLACQRPLWQYFIKASLPLYSALARAKKTSCTANTSGAISTDICRRGRGQDMYIYLLYTRIHTHILLLYIYIYYLDLFIIHTRYAKTSKTSKHEFTRKARSQTTAHPKLLFRLSSFLFLEHQSVNAKRRALIILSNRAKVLRNSQDKLIPANLWVSPFFLEKTASNKTQIFLCVFSRWSLSGSHSVDFTPNVSPPRRFCLQKCQIISWTLCV